MMISEPALTISRVVFIAICAVGCLHAFREASAENMRKAAQPREWSRLVREFGLYLSVGGSVAVLWCLVLFLEPATNVLLVVLGVVFVVGWFAVSWTSWSDEFGGGWREFGNFALVVLAYLLFCFICLESDLHPVVGEVFGGGLLVVIALAVMVGVLPSLKVRVPMNGKQELAVILAIMLFVLLLACPPWVERVNIPYRLHSERPLGYGPIFSPPTPGEVLPNIVEIDGSRLFLELAILGAFTIGLFLALRDRGRGGNSEITVNGDARAVPPYHTERNPMEMLNGTPAGREEEVEIIDLDQIREQMKRDVEEYGDGSLNVGEVPDLRLLEEIAIIEQAVADARNRGESPFALATSPGSNQKPLNRNQLGIGLKIYEQTADRADWETRMRRALGPIDGARLQSIWDDVTKRR